VTSFTAPISVTLSYDPLTISSTINISTLKIYRYDVGVWNPLTNCVRDTEQHKVTCDTSHFSDFALFGDPNTSTVIYGASYFVGGGSSSSSSGYATSTITKTASTTTAATTTKVISKQVLPVLPTSSQSVATTAKPKVKETKVVVPVKSVTIIKPTIAISPEVSKSTSTLLILPEPVKPEKIDLIMPTIPHSKNLLDEFSIVIYRAIHGLCLWGCR
jgi:hypothetical protein